MGLIKNIFGKKEQEVISHADYNRIFENKVLEDATIEVMEIGNVNFPTGKIIVCDPLAYPDTPAFNKTVTPGIYPVKIYVAKTPDDKRNAVAKLEFKTTRADKWVLALKGDEDVSKLDGNDFYGFPVDAGLGGFMDEQAGIAYEKFCDEFWRKNPEGNIYNDFFDAEFRKSVADLSNEQDRGDWVNFQLPGTDLNITMFSSGYGDGVYPAYWGMTNKNEIVSLVIDFHVLLLPDEGK